ncbi:hypothetical protein SAMN05661012_05182 [Chitinophaga sancti]|uniref:Uncharacterized protein n=1 Tax=Chitinophaga sancti TaxID=1004 RepID=A0A1K1SCE4_9BACT|nr:hypothetical protein SAMN05661012_05182 [Chitinophaga sancti]
MLGNFEISFLGDQELSFEANPVGLSYMSLLKAAKFIKYKRIDICIINRSETLLEVEGIDCSLCQVNINYDVSITSYFFQNMHKPPQKSHIKLQYHHQGQ